MHFQLKESAKLEAAAKEAAQLRFLKEQERQKAEKQEEKRRIQLAKEQYFLVFLRSPIGVC